MYGHKNGPNFVINSKPMGVNMSSTANNSMALVKRLLKSLRDSTSPDNFCQQLALSVLRDYKIEATYVARLDTDGCITMVGSWGYPVERRRIDDRPSIQTRMAITDTIREGKTLVFPTWDLYMDAYPHLEHRAGPGKAFVCVPFSQDGTRAGGVGISFAQTLDKVPIPDDVLELLAICCDVMIASTWAQSAFSARKEGLPTKAIADLSLRQKTILQLVAEGYQNADIAHKLRYSGSLVKKELQALYRLFGVADRKGLGILWHEFSGSAPNYFQDDSAD
jgi:DNA-binding CsgD family transcriptional regulator